MLLAIQKTQETFVINLYSNAHSHSLQLLPANAAGKLHVGWHDGDALGVKGAEVGILEEGREVCLGGLLQGHDGVALEPQITLDTSGHLPNKTLKGKLADEKLRGLLVAANLAKSHSAGAIPVQFLDPSALSGFAGRC